MTTDETLTMLSCIRYDLQALSNRQEDYLHKISVERGVPDTYMEERAGTTGHAIDLIDVMIDAVSGVRL